MQYFGNSNKEDIHAVGLVFEPNFFRVYFYSDRDAQKLVAAEKVENGAASALKNIASLYPLFAITFNAHYTLVPNALFNEDHAQDILAFNTESKSPNVDWNNDPVNQDKIIFELDIHAEQYLDKTFPGLQLKHGAHALISFCKNIQTANRCSLLLKNGERYTVTIVESGRTKYINTIEAKHAEDVVYFLLYTLKTLKFDLSSPLYLLGNYRDEESLISVLQTYLPEVNIHSPVPTNLPLNSQERTEHWAGVYASICAL